MTDTFEPTTASSAGPTAASEAPKKRTGGLSSMLLADLRSMAGGLGISGAGSMKKADLVGAIKAAQSAPSRPKQDPPPQERTRQERPPRDEPAKEQAQRDEPQEQPSREEPGRDQTGDGGAPKKNKQKQPKADQQDRQDKQDKPAKQAEPERDDAAAASDAADASDGGQGGAQQLGPDGEPRTGRNRRRRGRDRNRAGIDGPAAPAGPQGYQGGNQGNQGNQGGQGQGQGGHGAHGGQSGPPGQQRHQGGQRHEPDTTILEDDVVVPAAGILDVLDNYAFVRTSGYLPGPDDVYLSLSMVRKFGLRRGDAIAGQVRQPREGERREKFNPMVRIDTVNGHDPETAKVRVEFAKLTPLSPSERLRLETDPGNTIGRLIDIAAPIGKGQRGLVVSPARAGRTTVLQSIATSISTNHPECHLMVVLVDERPEEVTDFERSVKGEVVSSTFDRPAGDHTMVAELAIERAKRLVELGHDVVVLVDGLTRLGRAYNLSLPASGRILAGGVDTAALHPPKKFFGAARNIENGGSLTIIATAVVESGSRTDEVIFEELEGTANMELRLRGDLADRRLFPAIDTIASGTRREELLLGEEELAIVWKLRRVLSTLEPQQALELLLERLRKAHTNIEFLTQVQQAAPTVPTSSRQDG